MSYKKLEIWKIARKLVIDIHKMTLNELPKFEMYEEGSQIRRTIKSVKSNIVKDMDAENIYKNIFVFLHFRLVLMMKR